MDLVDVLFMDVDDGEFIVGNDLLTSLGIDVDRQLEQLANRGDDEFAGDPIPVESDDIPTLSVLKEDRDKDISNAVES